MRRISRAVAVVAATAALAALTGCAGQGETPDDPLQLPPEVVRLYGTDGNMLNSVGDLLVDHPDGIVGMKGTTPLSRLSQNFKDRLRSVDPQLNDDSYAGETYDAVVISALAAQIARTTDPQAIAGSDQRGHHDRHAVRHPARLPEPRRGRHRHRVPGASRSGSAASPTPASRRRARTASCASPTATTSTPARPSTSRPATPSRATTQAPPAPAAHGRHRPAEDRRPAAEDR